MEAREAVITVNHASILQENKTVINDLSFRLFEGEFVYLIGKTGSGKSSILKTLYADLPVNSGSVMVAGFGVSKIKAAEVPWLRRKLGIIFQDFQLFTDRDVRENLLFVLKATGWSDRIKMQQRIETVLEQVGLAGVEKKYPHQLSGGEQQRVAIARSLLNYPEIILADEPTGNLDPSVANEILDLFVQIHREGTSVLMATHHHSFLKRFPSRVLYCINGMVRDVQKEQVIKRMLD